MHLKLTLGILFILLFSSFSYSQKLTGDKILRLESHPSDNTKFIAKFYSKESRKLEEFWTMGTSVTEINGSNFNQLVKDSKIWPDGEHYLFHKNAKKKLETKYTPESYERKATAFYDSGEIEHVTSYVYFNEGETTYFDKKGNIIKKESFSQGTPFLKCTAESFFSDGQKMMVCEYENGKLNGKLQIFYPNGKTKRKAKIEKEVWVLNKCFDENGKAESCHPIYSKPEFPGGLGALKSVIKKIDFGFNKNNKDTSNMTIKIHVDAFGKATMIDYSFKPVDSIKSILNNWVKQLPPIKPARFDGQITESNISLNFPVSGENPVWVGEAVNMRSKMNLFYEANLYQTWNWTYPDPANNNIYFIIENMPTFPGGENALKSFISKNIAYPKEAKKKRIYGKVYITFTINKQGKPTNLKVAKGLHPALDKEALRVVCLMPNWTPGTNNGTPVNVSYTVPINFK